MLKPEAVALFRAHYRGVEPAVDMESPTVLQALGGGCQGDMFMEQLERVLKHCTAGRRARSRRRRLTRCGILTW